MKVAVVGGGLLGLTLAWRLQRMGHELTVFEAGPQLGGLATYHDYGGFVWDRFYHVVLAQDRRLIGLLQELGLRDRLRFRKTGTGYFVRGQLWPMSSNLDLLRFPLLGFSDKARLASLVLYALSVRDPWPLYRISAKDWLTRICGRRAYTFFWAPLLKAKFGPYAERVAAVFLWATLTRLFGARSGAGAEEAMGYVQGGYATILRAFRSRLTERGGRVQTGTPVLRIETAARGDYGPAATLSVRPLGEEPRSEGFDQVIFTGPTRLARELVAEELQPQVQAVLRDYPTGSTYLGVACLVLTLTRPLTPHYLTNIGDPGVELTGLVEMGNLVDRREETAGLSLLYLPRYLDSRDPLLRAPDEQLAGPMLERGLGRMFPDFDPRTIRYQAVHRAPFVQALPLVRSERVRPRPLPQLQRPFQVLNTSMLACATLNNDEVVGLVDRFVEGNRPMLRALAG